MRSKAEFGCATGLWLAYSCGTHAYVSGTLGVANRALSMRTSPDSPCCLQELADAKVTHNIDGFVHKAFSVAFGTSFDEVRRTNRNLSGTEGCMARMMVMMFLVNVLTQKQFNSAHGSTLDVQIIRSLCLPQSQWA